MRATTTSEDQLSLLGHPDAATEGTVDPGRHMQEPPTHEPSKRMKTRRPRGTGAVLQKGDRWYGQWYIRGRLVKRSLGPVRQPGTRDGLTKSQAEVRLRELMTEMNSAPPPVAERLTVGQVGSRLIKQLALKGRKSSTTENYESYLRVHIEPHFADKPIAQITAADVEDFVEACLDRGLSTKSTLNCLGFLHGIFDFAIRKRWAHVNPCDEVEKPGRATEDEEIRFLDQAELEALLRAMEAERSPHKPVTIERVDGRRLAGQRIRVRRNFVRGQFGSPKSKRSSRSVPLADVVAAALDALYKTSAYTADEDLVFAHPHTGRPMDRSQLLKRFKRALKRAGVREVRFHDLRHTFGTRMAAAGVPMRTLQEWMGHRDYKTTLIYADYAPAANEAEFVNAAFGRKGINEGIKLSATTHHEERENAEEARV